MYICPLCHAMMYPIIEDNPEASGDLKKKYLCVSCKEDMTPFIEAYLDYVVKSGEERMKENSNVTE